MGEETKRNVPVDEVWRAYMTGGQLPQGVSLPWYESAGMRAIARRLPSDPRCNVCYYPFGGLGGKIVRSLIRLEPSKMNPHLCNVCERFAEEHPGGAELEVALLFADIRGSTPLAAKMNARDFSRLIDRFYKVTTNVIFMHGGLVANLKGDGIAAFFPPAFTEDHNYAGAAVRAGRAILAETGHGNVDGPWVPVGVGIHTGEAYVGAVGEPGRNLDITVLGDNVNITSRLSDQAQQGEMLVSEATVSGAGLDTSGHELRSLTLKGKEEPFAAWVYAAERERP